jgi:hypothetical protein
MGTLLSAHNHLRVSHLFVSGPICEHLDKRPGSNQARLPSATSRGSS